MHTLVPAGSPTAPMPVTETRPSGARRRILDAARDLIRLHGYERFTMETVAMRSGLTRRTIYNQFEDRDALYRASRLELLASVEATLPFEVAKGGETIDVMQRFFADALAALATPEHRELHDSVQRDAHVVPWLREFYAHRVERPLRLAIEHYLLTRQASGALRIGDAEPHARHAITMIKAAAGTPDTLAFDAAELALIMTGRLDKAASPPLQH